MPETEAEAQHLLGLILMEHPGLGNFLQQMNELVPRIGSLDDDGRPLPGYEHLYKPEELDAEGRVRELIDVSTLGEEPGTRLVQGPPVKRVGESDGEFAHRVTHPEDDGYGDDRGKLQQRHPNDTDGTGRDQGQWTPDYRYKPS